MNTCQEVINLRSPVGSEKRRGFQPPWYTVYVYECANGHKHYVRKSWNGPAPLGGIRCDREVAS